MTRKKLLAVFILLLAGFQAVQLRLLFISSNADYAAAGTAQSTYTLTVSADRPDFYDRSGEALTGNGYVYKALVVPAEASGANALSYVDSDARDDFLKRYSQGLPFLADVEQPLPEQALVETLKVKKRYEETQTAAHLIGYLDYDSAGASGLEAALDGYLSENTVRTLATSALNAAGRQALGAGVEIRAPNTDYAGVTLTIDARIQRLAEAVADECFTRGAIVVADCKTSELLAAVSRPTFDANDISASIEAEDTSLINRVFTPYSVGSIYKPVVAAAALEAGIKTFDFECTGSVSAGNAVFACDNFTAHGKLDMRGALEHSCNSYFVSLGQKLGGTAIYNMACSLGLGTGIYMYGGLAGQAGSLPTPMQLSQPGELANHCFGQGRLLASPAQITAYMAAIANGGEYRQPECVLYVGEEKRVDGTARRAMSEYSAARLRSWLVSVVENGTGANAKPMLCTAGGKTGTAETGGLNADGSAKVIGWFTGFFPAEEPRYAVTVMVENEGYGYETAAPVFKRLADGICILESNR